MILVTSSVYRIGEQEIEKCLGFSLQTLFLWVYSLYGRNHYNKLLKIDATPPFLKGVGGIFLKNSISNIE